MMKCLETSVLLHAVDTASPSHARAVELIEQTVKGQWAACVCYESLLELADAITDPQQASRPLDPSAARRLLDKLLQSPQPQVLFSDAVILRRAFRLMEKYPALGGRFREAHLAATMLTHGVKVLVTADSGPYLSIREIEVENPFESLFA